MRWIRVGTEFVGAVVRRFEVPIAPHQHFAGIPTRTDQNVFKFIVRDTSGLTRGGRFETALASNSEDRPQGISLGEFILTEFFIVGLSSAPIKPTFVSRWKQMLGFALGDVAWTETGSLTRFEAWDHILGFDNVISVAWTAGMQSVVGEIKNYYWRWLDNFNGSPSGLLPFLRFLSRPAAERIICESLARLGRFFEDTNDYFWSRPQNRQTLSTFRWDPVDRPLRGNQVFG